MNNESQNIEWKQSWDDDYLKCICGFANAQGGRLYIGRDDNGKVIGLKNERKLIEDLPNKIRDHLGLMPHINLQHEDGEAYLEIIIEPSTVPISLRGSYYWRSGSVQQELKGHALTEFLLKKVGMTWDRMVDKKATLNDIDEMTIERFKEDSAVAGRLPDLARLSKREILKKLRLLTMDGITNAALVLFGKDPGEFYPNIYVKIGRFGESVVDMRFQEVCEGNLFQMLHDVMEQLDKKFLVKPVRFEGLRRIEELEYPTSALREMLLNALVHRNYMGSMTQLKVFDSKLSLWNAGTLPVELTIEKLFREHESFPRNPLIADVCYKAGYIDSWGRGIEKIKDACKQAGRPNPIISERNGGIEIELFKSKLETTAKVSGKRRESVGKTSGMVLAACRENSSITIPEMSQKIGITERSVQRNIQKLQKDGLLRRVGGRKEGYWEVLEKE
ncbi:winged helix-turn-helix transcriptional regulator [Candidatus Saccharibacteria bacterium]|nr:winged helix-turn-helix transcriptional regulator [Candidatus Saccharibacteria bacterium]